MCAAPVASKATHVAMDSTVRLDCQVDSNLAEVSWLFNGEPLQVLVQKHYLFPQGLLLLSASTSDLGEYTCQATEHSGGHPYSHVIAAYQLLPLQPVIPEPGVGEGGGEGGDDQGDGTDEDEGPGATEPPVSKVTAPKKGTTTTGGDDDSTPEQPQPNAEVRQVTGLQVAVASLALILICVLGVGLFLGRGRIRSRFRSTPSSARNGTAYHPAPQGKEDNHRTDQNFNTPTTVTFSGKGVSNGPSVAITTIGEESEI